MQTARGHLSPLCDIPEHLLERCIGAARSSESESLESECEKQDVTSPDLFGEDKDNDECEPELMGNWESTEEVEVGESRRRLRK